MNECEIYLSKLADRDELFSEVASKLGICKNAVPSTDDISQKLSAVSSPTKFKLYVSIKKKPNENIPEIIGIFKNAGEQNENISSEVIEDEFLNLFKEGRITSDIKPRCLVHRDGDLHPTVHVWIIKRMDMGIYALLQKRSSLKDTHPDCYDVSSAGHVSQGSEFRDSAVRELKEELGLNISPEKLDFIGMQNHFSSETFNDKKIIDNEVSAVYLYSENVKIEDLTIQDSEVSEVCWAEIDELLSVMNKGSFKHCIQAEELYKIKKSVF